MRSTSFTVVVSPREPGLDILAILRDWSALGLVTDFVWVDLESLGTDGGPVRGLLVSAGSARPVGLQHELARLGQVDRMRVCAVDPLSGQDIPVAGEAIRSLLSAASPTTPQTLVQCVTTVIGASGVDGTRVRQGWHGVVLAPEDSQTPRSSRRQITVDEDQLRLARHYAAGMAGVLALWTGATESPLDPLKSEAPDLVRLARGYFQRLDASEFSSVVRNSLTTVYPDLPRPVADGSPLPRVADEERAVDKAAAGLFGQHDWLLRSEREARPASTQQRIGFGRSIKMFFGFLLAALKSAPRDWWQRQLSKGATRIAAVTQRQVYGEGSEYAVVVRGRLPDGRPASMSQIVDSRDRMLAALPDTRHTETSHDLAPFWRDFHEIGLDLADGAERVPGAMPPRVGAQPAVVSHARTIAVPPSESFRDIPPHIAASLDIDRISPADLNATTEMLDELANLETSSAVDTGATRSDLQSWSERVQKPNYAGKVGGRLADAMDRLRTEMDQIRARLLHLDESMSPDSGFADRQKALARRARLLLWLGVAVVVGLLVVGQMGWLPWAEAIKWIALAVVIEVALQLFWFLRGQQALFQFLHRQEELEREAKVLLRNLAATLRDLNRVEAAYRQFVPMAGVLGSFVKEPLGPPIPVPPKAALPEGGLPLSVKLGRVEYDAKVVQPMLADLSATAFPVGWMTEPYRGLVSDVGRVLGPGSEEFVRDPKLIFSEVGTETNPAMRRWAEALEQNGTSRDQGDQVWDRAVRVIVGQREEASLPTLIDQSKWADNQVPGAGLCGGLTDQDAELSQFDTAILQPGIAPGPGREPDPEAIQVYRSADGLSELCSLVVLGKPFRIQDLNVRWKGRESSKPVEPLRPGPNI